MPNLLKARRYWETLRHLRSPQIWGRLAYRWHTPSPPPAIPAPPRAQPGKWIPPAQRKPSVTSQGGFVFLNVSGDLANDGWDGPSQEKLWRYNQHYFDDLNAYGAPSRCAWHHALLDAWIKQNPPACGTGWEPYPTSLRVVNWIKWSLGGGAADSVFLDSLATQVRWLSRRLETHLLGNHLVANAKALVFAGSYFQGQEADEWMRIGSQILQREIPEQILRDGGQFERSPMYHALAFEDLLDLLNLSQCYRGTGAEDAGLYIEPGPERLQTMWRWLHTMSHPDGDLALFNDTARDIAPSVQELNGYARRLGLEQPSEVGMIHLADSGYVRLQLGNAIVLFDAAPVGPDYLPAHAHADTLSLELSLAGARVLVNSGTSLYAEGKERSRQRGTRAHNTVVVDGQDSSEVWSSFRVARRAYPHDIRLSQQADTQQVSASHNGYTRLRGQPVHWRSVTLRSNRCMIADRIDGIFQRAQSRFHFHPAVIVSVEPDELQGTCRVSNGEILKWQVKGGTAKVESSTWHPAFGSSLANQCIDIEWNESQCHFEIVWGSGTAD